MSNDMRDWLGIALTAASFFISLYSLSNDSNSRRRRWRERFRSFKGWGVEWKAYDRDDDTKS